MKPSLRLSLVNGRLYDAATMDEVGEHPRKRGQLSWELERPEP